MITNALKSIGLFGMTWSIFILLVEEAVKVNEEVRKKFPYYSRGLIFNDPVFVERRVAPVLDEGTLLGLVL